MPSELHQFVKIEWPEFVAICQTVPVVEARPLTLSDNVHHRIGITGRRDFDTATTGTQAQLPDRPGWHPARGPIRANLIFATDRTVVGHFTQFFEGDRTELFAKHAVVPLF